ncbi:MAG TPA: PEP-CTERM sorting domain-containing protein [Candidatus Krumholzibacteria bacterium]|nr:PEP-CTERM sorting domain-containing protein [Candidatus Krumholzibacteria bacterium]
MKPRIIAFVVASLFVGSQAGASILSASSQAVREPSIEAAGQWTATTLQNDLNASLRDASDASSAAGPLASTRTPVTGGLVVNGGGTGASYTPFSGSAAFDGLFEMNQESGTVTRGSWDPSGPVIASSGGRGGRDRDRDRDRGRGRYRDRDRPRDRPNPYATPEPSTWVLLGSGLLAIGAFAGLRRRQALSF